jgi:membrane protease YdiL (CAAX protease family)
MSVQPASRHRPFAETLTKRQRIIGTLFIPLYCFGLLGIVFISPLLHGIHHWFMLSQSSPSLLTLLSLTLSSVVYLGVAFMFRGFFKQAFQALRDQWGKTILWIGIGIVGMFVLGNIVMPNVVAIFHPVTTPANQNQMAELVRSYPLFMPLMIVLVGPLMEELVYRVSIFRALIGRSRLLAYVLSSLLFGFQHVMQAVVFDQNYTELWNMLPYIASGLWISYLYDRRRNILVPLLVHILNNLLGVLFILGQG